MRILFFSKNGLAIDLTRILQKEGHWVKLYIDGRPHRECFNGLVEKTNNWEKELDWVGKDGLIIFDDRGYGEIQDDLRERGFAVFGGSAEADKLELNRSYAQEVFSSHGLRTSLLKDFYSVDEAISFVRKNPRAWVIKQHNDIDKHMHYVGQKVDGSDIISVLEQRRTIFNSAKEAITLHERIEGIEIGIGRYFNGEDWVGPIEFNIEHTRLLAGDLGPITNEMGTLAWYGNDECRLYKQTLALMEPYLRKIKFKGDFDLNCVANEQGIFILEATPRLGSPIIHLQQELHESPWGEFLNAIARGQQYDLKWHKGYGVVVLVAAQPFPASERDNSPSLYGLNFSFSDLTKLEKSHVHFEEIALSNLNTQSYYIADRYGYIAYVTGVGETIEVAQRKVYSIVKKLAIPKTFYRNDIGTTFSKINFRKLKKAGYLS